MKKSKSCFTLKSKLIVFAVYYRRIAAYYRWIALQKMLFLLRFFCLVYSQNIKKFLNQEGFSRQVKIIVLFSEKNKLKGNNLQ